MKERMIADISSSGLGYATEEAAPEEAMKAAELAARLYRPLSRQDLGNRQTEDHAPRPSSYPL